MLIGISRLSHCPSVISKLARHSDRRATRLYFDFSFPVKEQRARIAGANNLPRGDFNQMRMFLRQPGTAKLAVLEQPRCRAARRANCAELRSLLKAAAPNCMAFLRHQSRPVNRAIAARCPRRPLPCGCASRLSNATNPPTLRPSSPRTPATPDPAQIHRCRLRRLCAVPSCLSRRHAHVEVTRTCTLPSSTLTSSIVCASLRSRGRIASIAFSHARLQIIGMQRIQQQQACNLRILPQLVDRRLPLLRRPRKQSPSSVPEPRRARPSRAELNLSPATFAGLSGNCSS